MDRSSEKKDEFKPGTTKRNSTDEPENPSKEKRFKRSSLVSALGGRRSSVKFDFIEGEHNKEIFSLIPTILPPSERFCSLVRHSAQFSMKRSLADVFDTNKTTDNQETFKIALEAQLEKFTTDGTCNAITPSITKQEQASVDLELEEMIKKTNEYIGRLTDETKHWDDVLSSCDQERQSVKSETIDSKGATSRNVATDSDDLTQGLAIKKQRLRLQVKVLTQASSTVFNFSSKVEEPLSVEANKLNVCDDSKKRLRAVIETKSKD